MTRIADRQRQVLPVAIRSRSVARAHESLRKPALTPLDRWAKISAAGGLVCGLVFMSFILWSFPSERQSLWQAVVLSILVVVTLGCASAAAGAVAGQCSRFLPAKWMKILASSCLEALIIGGPMLGNAEHIVALLLGGLGALNGLVAALIVESGFGIRKRRSALSAASGTVSRRAAIGPGQTDELSPARRRWRVWIAAPSGPIARKGAVSIGRR